MSEQNPTEKQINFSSKEIPKSVPESVRKLIEKLMVEKSRQEAAPQHKPMEEYKFWKTQPVAKFNGEKPENSELKDSDPALPQNSVAKVEQGPFENKKVSDISSTPQSLPTGFEWCTVDITSPTHLNELYDLLYGNYVEDDSEQFRFKYSVPFLKWALTPPGWNPSWAVGVRASENKKLLAFISAIPAELSIWNEVIKSVEINFLCVHKNLRSKRMAPVLIKEITRRVNLTDIWQALFTAGALIPTPISTAHYFHRVLDWVKLYDVGFAALEPGSSRAKEVARCTLPTKIDLPGFRELRADDIDQVYPLLTNYLAKFSLHQKFTLEEMHHWFAPSSADGIVFSYVVEQDGKITDFVSAFGLESSVFGNSKYDAIKVAYAFYYATSESGSALKPRLERLFQGLLIKLKGYNYDVLNALSIMDNPLILDTLKFKRGDGRLNYNLFNWNTAPISGGMDDQLKSTSPGGIGVVML